MLPREYEYLIVLLVLALFVCATGWDQVRALMRDKPFWLSLAVYMALCAILDVSAVRLGWWSFPAPTNIGIVVCRVPIEEFLLFILIFVSAIVAWKFLAQ
jgi:lycopene cyclase domain-containing protein